MNTELENINHELDGNQDDENGKTGFSKLMACGKLVTHPTGKF